MRKYHHMGIPTTVVKDNEIYHEGMKFTSTPFLDNEYRIQWHRFDPECKLAEIIKTKPHVAFIVDSIEKEIEGKKVVLGPYEPIPGYRVAIVEYEGVPLEFIETELTDEELAAYSEPLKND